MAWNVQAEFEVKILSAIWWRVVSIGWIAADPRLSVEYEICDPAFIGVTGILRWRE